MEKLNILHIASISNDSFNGVCVVVPQHVYYQNLYHNTALLNMSNDRLVGVENQLVVDGDFELKKLKEPFNSPDIVIFHETYRIEYLKIAKILRKEKIPYVIMPHGELGKYAQQKKWLKKKIANLLLFNRFINGANALQCLSNVEINQTECGRNKFLGSNAVDVPAVHKEYFSENKVQFTYVGRLDAYHKGLDIMVEAVSLKAKEFREYNCRFDIYGPDIKGRGDILKQLICEFKVQDLVFLHPPVSGTEKQNVLLSTDIFIQTSRFEGMPLGVLEALSYAIPCVITEGTNLGAYVTQVDAGWVCETSSDAVSQVLISAISERKKWREKGYNARALIESEFSWKEISKKTTEEYLKLVK